MLQKLKNKPIIINLDLDGLLSGLLLQKYLNCSIVGFSNSAETIWLKDDFNAYDSVCFVDLFVANPLSVCIDQHIVSVNKEHHQILSKNPNKINPNLLKERTFLPVESYTMKYPFGTIHFLIALLEAEKIPMQLELEKEIGNLTLINLILRADDCMKTTMDSKYQKNAAQWWKWLQKLADNGKYTKAFIQYLSQLTSKESERIKIQIKHSLISTPFHCNTSDGGIDNILDSSKYIKENVRHYFMFLSDFLQVDIFNWFVKYKKFMGIAKRTSINNKEQLELINSKKINDKTLFSYAFVKSSKKQDNFSYTVFKTK